MSLLVCNNVICYLEHVMGFSDGKIFEQDCLASQTCLKYQETHSQSVVV